MLRLARNEGAGWPFGGIGRRTGFKNPRPHGHPSSILGGATWLPHEARTRKTESHGTSMMNFLSRFAFYAVTAWIVLAPSVAMVPAPEIVRKWIPGWLMFSNPHP